MVLIDDLMLNTGVDIPFISAEVAIHQLTPYDIGHITEKNYFLGIGLLNFSKEQLSEKDKTRLSNKSDFEILMSIMIEGAADPNLAERIQGALLVLSLLFPDYEISLQPNAIVLQKEGEPPKTINQFNYDDFKQIIRKMCVLDKESEAQRTYNPGGPKAKALAEKFRKYREKIAQNKGKEEKVAVYSRYISILSVALHLSINEVSHYSLFQIDDLMERYGLHQASEKYFSAKVAGASGMKEPDNWMKDIH